MNEEKSAEVVSFADQVEAEFTRLYQQYRIADAPERRVPDMIDAIWPKIYKKIFELDESGSWINCSHTRLRTWRYLDVESVCDTYINLCRVYGGKIKLNSFCELTGIHRYTLDLWHEKNINNTDVFELSMKDIEKEYKDTVYIFNNINGEDIVRRPEWHEMKLSTKRIDVRKKIVAAAREQSRNARSIDTVGNIQMSNNDEELGFLYDTKRDFRKESIRQALTVDDLPKLGNLNRSAETQDIVCNAIPNTTYAKMKENSEQK